MSTHAIQSRVLEHLGSERTKTLTDREHVRIAATIAMIPHDVMSVLDVGCGDGRIIDELPERCRTAGVDYSWNSISGLRATGVQASSGSLPFQDRVFDLVMCCEVLEHLSQEIFVRTVKELERVSRKYIIITVPYKENLRTRRTKCPKCGTEFHVWGHVRSFGDADLDHLFASFRTRSSQYVGKRPPYQNGAAVYLNQRFGKKWTEFVETTMCPNCGNLESPPVPRNVVTIACGLLYLATSKLLPVFHDNWALKLFSRCQ